MLAPNRERDTNKDRGIERFSPEIGIIDDDALRWRQRDLLPPSLSAKLVTKSCDVFISSMLRTQRKAKLIRR